MAIGRVNTGGGGSGGTLVVTGVAGHTVTATKGDNTYSRTINPQGKAVFRGLATGEWVLTMQGGGQTATRRITITADYAVTITYFAATINITYPANSKCTVSNAAGQQVATDTNATASPKTWACTVGAADTYTIKADSTTGDSKTKTTTAQITSEGQSVAVTLTFELVLFDGSAGGDNTAVTGGWSKPSNVTTKQIHIVVHKRNDGFAQSDSMETTASIERGTYTKLCLVGTMAAVDSYSSAQLHYGGGEAGVGEKKTVTYTQESPLRLDISNAQPSPIKLEVFSGSGRGEITCTRLWME